MKRILLSGIALAILAACQPRIPDSAAGVGFDNEINAPQARARREADLSGQAVPPPRAVSEETARMMAEGALDRSGADLAIAITGLAGPGGGTPEKPVGLVHIAAASHGLATLHARHIFQGDRTAIRLQCVRAAIDLLAKQVERRRA